MTHAAVVRWASSAQRGRRSLPATLRYVGLSRFAEDGARWPDGAWSIEAKFNQPPPEQGSDEISMATVRFLVDEAPQTRLRRGARFCLYEGLQKVAEVEVLS
jgi:hypothetical protein